MLAASHAAAWLAAPLCALPAMAGAAGGLQLVIEGASGLGNGPYDEFVQQLQMQQALRAPTSAPGATDDLALDGIRTRSLPPLANSGRPAISQPSAAQPARVTVAVGARAAQAALDATQERTPLLLALLSRMDYAALSRHPAMTQPQRPMAVLLREPALGVQLALARMMLPDASHLGVIASADIEPLVAELRQAESPLHVAVRYAVDAASLSDALRSILPEADALLILSDRLGNDATASLTLLHAAAAARKPAFATSEASVRAGALAAAIATPAQLASQALALSDQLAQGAALRHAPAPILQPAMSVSVRVNQNVAARLGIVLPNAARLAEQLNASLSLHPF